MTSIHKIFAVATAIAAMTLFASHAIMMRAMMGKVDPLAYACLRGLLAGATLLIIEARALAYQFDRLLLFKAAIVATFAFGLNQVLLIEGILKTGSLNVAFFNGMVPLVTVFMTLCLKLEKIGFPRFSGISLGFLVSFSSVLILNQKTVSALDMGDFFLLGYALSSGGSIALIRLLTKSVSSSVLACLVLLLGGAILGLVSFNHLPATVEILTSSWTMILITLFDSLICTGLAWVLLIKSIASLGAIQTAAFSYLQTPLIVMMSWFVFYETPHKLFPLLFVLTLCSVTLVVVGTPMIKRRD